MSKYYKIIRLQSTAVFWCEISVAEKAQIIGAGVGNSWQVRIMTALRGKCNKICVKNNKIRVLGAD